MHSSISFLPAFSPKVRSVMTRRTSGEDEISALRAKQIDSLLQQFPTLQVVQKESVYDIPVNLQGQTFVLRMCVKGASTTILILLIEH